MGKGIRHFGYQDDLVDEPTNLGGANKRANFVAARNLTDFLHLERVADKNEPAIEPGFGELCR